MSQLLDNNVLVALVIADHVHHGSARTWIRTSTERVATCPITQGALIRMLLRSGVSAGDATAALARVTEHERHDFWPDDLDYHSVSMRGVLGHRQVTDAYLAQLARNRGGQLVTMDKGLAALHDDVTVLLPMS